MRNANKETQSEAISLNYTVWSFATILSGFMFYILSSVNQAFFDEKFLLQISTLFSICSFVILLFIKINERVPSINSNRYSLADFDWFLIFKSLVPVVIIAVGAGLTIPFINLFFYHTHGLDFDKFSFLGSATAVMVALGTLYVPFIKRKFGYKIAVTASQSLAVIALVFLATTGFYSHLSFAVYIAVFCYMLRQPLMNMAAPMTSELTMNYVGSRNQEMTSALIASIWSGSWFFSSQIFRFFRTHGYSYGVIFLITAALYAVGVVWYYFLIVDYEKQKNGGVVQSL